VDNIEGTQKIVHAGDAYERCHELEKASPLDVAGTRISVKLAESLQIHLLFFIKKQKARRTQSSRLAFCLQSETGAPDRAP
ncbi:hypothetical protein R0J90_21725, partial [Micrococcus sp. SIMBA_144]